MELIYHPVVSELPVSWLWFQVPGYFYGFLFQVMISEGKVVTSLFFSVFKCYAEKAKIKQ